MFSVVIAQSGERLRAQYWNPKPFPPEMKIGLSLFSFIYLLAQTATPLHSYRSLNVPGGHECDWCLVIRAADRAVIWMILLYSETETLLMEPRCLSLTNWVVRWPTPSPPLVQAHWKKPGFTRFTRASDLWVTGAVWRVTLGCGVAGNRHKRLRSSTVCPRLTELSVGRCRAVS